MRVVILILAIFLCLAIGSAFIIKPDWSVSARYVIPLLFLLLGLCIFLLGLVAYFRLMTPQQRFVTALMAVAMPAGFVSLLAAMSADSFHIETSGSFRNLPEGEGKLFDGKLMAGTSGGAWPKVFAFVVFIAAECFAMVNFPVSGNDLFVGRSMLNPSLHSNQRQSEDQQIT